MSHGSKKWIVAYDGKIKRSNDRSKKDYYRGLRWWKPYGQRGWRVGNGKFDGDFCPQCKHNYKPIKAHNDAYYAEQKAISAEWDALEGERQRKFKQDWNRWVRNFCVGPEPVRPEYRWKDRWTFRKARETMLPPIREEETWLCPKHAHMNEVWDDHWYSGPYPGKKEHYTWVRKEQYRRYRSRMKDLMRQERYDDLEPYVPGWLD